MVDYKKNLTNLISNIEKARLKYDNKHIVKIIAVSKYSTSNEIKELYHAGQRAFGENKIQDLLTKQKDLEEFPIEWHFIGTLQKNKINHLIEANVTLFHSLDSYDLALEINKRLEAKGKKLNALLQVNSSYEESKSGVDPVDADVIYKQITKDCPNIVLKGLMTIGANSDNIGRIKKSFEITKDIFMKLDCDILSMGMSGDYEYAIENGSNMIRVGSTLFK